MCADKSYIDEAQPCPFCCSVNLSAGFWSLQRGEVDAIECNDCYAGAQLTSWNGRHNEIDGQVMAQLAGGDVPEHLKTL